MDVVIDTSAIIAVVANEPHRDFLIEATAGANLLAPPSVHWEIGNAFSAMFKRKRISLAQARRAIAAYRKVPIRFSDVELVTALELAERLDVYAYDAYVIACALRHNCPLLSLDSQLIKAASQAGTATVEVGV